MLKSKVLLPSDGSDTSMKAAAYAVRLMKINPEMRLTVLVVVPDSTEVADIMDQDKEAFKKIDEAMNEKGKEILAETVKVFKSEGLYVDGVIKKGDPAGKIIECARRGNFDHIIMGSRGVSELRELAIGSVSHKVIHLADCRVTLVK